MADPLNVYCDESGATGENLLNPQQKYFAYSSIAIGSEEASDLVASLIRQHRVQGRELKGQKLLRYASGRRAVSEVIASTVHRSQLVLHDKAYALAGRFVEWLLEPLLSDVMSAIYGVNFHRFVAMVLYKGWVSAHSQTRDLLVGFETAARGDDEQLRTAISRGDSAGNEPIDQLIAVCFHRRDEVLADLSRVRKNLKWLLELTTTSLASLLPYWGDRAESLRVFCDVSTPVNDGVPHLNMVGVTEKLVIRIGDAGGSYLYNLAEPIHVVDSVGSPGVQLADVLAAAACYVVQNATDPWSRETFRSLLVAGAIHDHSITPDDDHFDLRRFQPRANLMVLHEVARRARRGESLIDGIVEFVRRVHGSIPEMQVTRI